MCSVVNSSNYSFLLVRFQFQHLNLYYFESEANHSFIWSAAWTSETKINQERGFVALVQNQTVDYLGLYRIQNKQKENI